MSKKLLNSLVVIAILAVVAIWVTGLYNTMVVQQENVETAWGQVENQYQRRFDLIPNLVQVVKEAGLREHDNLVDVIEARAKATQMNIDASNLTEENLAAFQRAQGELSQALGRLMVIREQYPPLKTNENFQKLMDQLEGIENRITAARYTFNEEAQKYNQYIRKFPNNIIASMFGFERKPYFKSEEGAEKAPKVDFGRGETKVES
jgi:LemA protein